MDCNLTFQKRMRTKFNGLANAVEFDNVILDHTAITRFLNASAPTGSGGVDDDKIRLFACLRGNTCTEFKYDGKKSHLSIPAASVCVGSLSPMHVANTMPQFLLPWSSQMFPSWTSYVNEDVVTLDEAIKSAFPDFFGGAGVKIDAETNKGIDFRRLFAFWIQSRWIYDRALGATAPGGGLASFIASERKLNSFDSSKQLSMWLYHNTCVPYGEATLPFTDNRYLFTTIFRNFGIFSVNTDNSSKINDETIAEYEQVMLYRSTQIALIINTFARRTPLHGHKIFRDWVKVFKRCPTWHRFYFFIATMIQQVQDGQFYENIMMEQTDESSEYALSYDRDNEYFLTRELNLTKELPPRFGTLYEPQYKYDAMMMEGRLRFLAKALDRTLLPESDVLNGMLANDEETWNLLSGFRAFVSEMRDVRDSDIDFADDGVEFYWNLQYMRYSTDDPLFRYIMKKYMWERDLTEVRAMPLPRRFVHALDFINIWDTYGDASKFMAYVMHYDDVGLYDRLDWYNLKEKNPSLADLEENLDKFKGDENFKAEVEKVKNMVLNEWKVDPKKYEFDWIERAPWIPARK